MTGIKEQFYRAIGMEPEWVLPVELYSKFQSSKTKEEAEALYKPVFPDLTAENVLALEEMFLKRGLPVCNWLGYKYSKVTEKYYCQVMDGDNRETGEAETRSEALMNVVTQLLEAGVLTPEQVQRAVRG